jgi:hypothetical protein
MAITKTTRNKLLVEARHRCTICAEKAYELHHIIEQSEGGSDEAENLIVLCPNCHQHRYHRSGDITRDQVRLYKANLREQNEIERRLLLNIEEIRADIGKVPPSQTEERLRRELSEAASQVSAEKSPDLTAAVETTSRWLAERNTLRQGARAAIEAEWELRRAHDKGLYPPISISEVDETGYRKADDFPAAYRLVLNLNREPNPQWEQIFENEYHTSYYGMKRSTEVRGCTIVMIVADSDNLQGHVDFAKELVKRTNQTVERDVFRLIDQQIDRLKRQALEQFDAIQSLKAKTKNLVI